MLPATQRIWRRPATEADVPFLLQLRHRTMDAHLAASNIAVDEDEHRRRVRHRLDCAEIILCDGKPSGLLKVARDGKAWLLVQVQLAPELQGQGLGARLIEDIIAEARRAGASLQLDVLKTNPARRLYERLGFVVIGEDGHNVDMLLPAGR